MIFIIDTHGGFRSLKDNELNEIRQLIEMMQSSLVELFEQLRELRERLHIVTGLPSDSSPSIVPLFSEITPKAEKLENNHSNDSEEKTNDEPVTQVDDIESLSNPQSESNLEETADAQTPEDTIPDSAESSTINARVNRVLDPIAHELRTGEATAEIILEYLQAAKDYLIDDDEHKKKVGRDMDIPFGVWAIIQ